MKTQNTTIQISAAASAVLKAYADKFHQDTGGILTKTQMGNIALVKTHFAKLPKDEQTRLLAQYPELRHFMRSV